ncbi:MAG: metallophosphatase [Prevotellaceae bacterium]|jgi:5'-nucleotidase|nr:metallophosphatase [Prevotellaceae bacterium]
MKRTIIMGLKKYLVLIICQLFVCLAAAQDIIILHTNDVHSQMDVQISGQSVGLGGVERSAAYIAEVRKAHPHRVILLDAGDYNQGTPYFNLFGGKLEVKLMNVMGYDAASLGNHEFDNGQKDLAKRLRKAKYVSLCANYSFAKSPLKRAIKPYTVITRNGYKIGIIGVTVTLKGVVSAPAIEGLEFQNPVPIVNELALMLKNKKKCDFVICLSHLGYNGGSSARPSDIYLAEHSRNVDLIIGGHSHTLLQKPDIRKNLDDKELPIVQADSRGAYVGRVDLYFD